MDPSLSAESIPLTKMVSHRASDSIDDEERDTLLAHPDEPPPRRSPIFAMVCQIIAFTVIGVLVAVASGALAYSLRRHMDNSGEGFVHVPLPQLQDPSLLKYFGGSGPFIGGKYDAPPDQCKVTQVHMMSRHGERYPTTNTGALMTRFAKNISGASGDFTSRLKFLNDWTMATDDWIYSPSDQFEQETLTGPAAGSMRMFTLGSEFRARYGDIWDFRDHDQIKVWSSDSTRVIHSSKYFSSGFFGVNTNVTVEVIPETVEQTGNSITTAHSCLAYIQGKFNSSYAYNEAPATYYRTFLPGVVERLNEMAKNYRFTDDDALAMSSICPFQINALGYSPFCDVFSEKEWRDFNYARDLGTYYSSGPGNQYGNVMGQPWVEAVINLMKSDNSSNHNLYFSFSHDTDIVPIVPALGIFPAPNKDPMPWDTYDADRVFWTTSIVPMGGHIVVERLDCNSDIRVRVLVNERVQPIPGCDTPADEATLGICPLGQFEQIVKSRWDESFCEACDPDQPECVNSISFYESS